jgi:CHRD domain
MSKATRRRAAVRAGIAAAVVAAALVAATSASAYSWTVSMTAAQQCASGLSCDTGASGTANIFTGSNPNQLCGTFSWSGVHGSVGFGHIHEAKAGQPENIAFTINFFGPPTSTAGFQSPTTGCTTVPAQVQTYMNQAPGLFMTTIHTTAFPGGAIRGQLGTGTTLCPFSFACVKL